MMKTVVLQSLLVTTYSQVGAAGVIETKAMNKSPCGVRMGET